MQNSAVWPGFLQFEQIECLESEVREPWVAWASAGTGTVHVIAMEQACCSKLRWVTISAEVYVCSKVDEDKPETMASHTVERDSSAESTSNMRMQRKPSEVGAPSYVSHHGPIVMGHPALTTNHVARVQPDWLV